MRKKFVTNITFKVLGSTMFDSMALEIGLVFESCIAHFTLVRSLVSVKFLVLLKEACCYTNLLTLVTLIEFPTVCTDRKLQCHKNWIEGKFDMFQKGWPT